MTIQTSQLVTRKTHPTNTIISLGDVTIGNQNDLTLIAGPCAVEDETSFLTLTDQLIHLGVSFIRGSIYKPRTSPYSFQGLGDEGLKILDKAKRECGAKIITEAISINQLSAVAEIADIIQIGSRNMQHFPLLEAVGKIKKPVLLKRGFSATIDELLMSAEYILESGNPNVILCERGIRTFEPRTRNTMDVSAVPVVKDLSHLPIVVDPSHAVGDARFVPAMALSAVAAGCDGLMIEVHPDPENAKSDGKQSLTLDAFSALTKKISHISEAMTSE